MKLMKMNKLTNKLMKLLRMIKMKITDHQVIHKVLTKTTTNINHYPEKMIIGVNQFNNSPMISSHRKINKSDQNQITNQIDR